MRKKDRAALVKYIRWCGDELGLRDWTFEIQHVVDDQPNAARTVTLYGRHVACITFRDDFRGMSAEFQRMAVIHELIHVPFNVASWYIVKTLPDLVAPPVYDAFYGAFNQLDEMATDTLAEGIASRFPLIEWPK
jgi:hypothetical protein